MGAHSTAELSELGRDFFTKLFEKCDLVGSVFRFLTKKKELKEDKTTKKL